MSSLTNNPNPPRKRGAPVKRPAAVVDTVPVEAARKKALKRPRVKVRDIRTAKSFKYGDIRDTLTHTQLTLALTYIETYNHRKAILAAGYSLEGTNVDYGQYFTPPVLEAIGLFFDDRRKRDLKDPTWITQHFMEIHRKALADEPVYDKKGEPTGEYVFDGSNANRAIENIAKHYGYYEKDNQQKQQSPLGEIITNIQINSNGPVALIRK